MRGFGSISSRANPIKSRNVEESLFFQTRNRVSVTLSDDLRHGEEKLQPIDRPAHAAPIARRNRWRFGVWHDAGFNAQR